MCPYNSFVFIDNNNIPTSSLFRDGLHLLETGNRILANNFIDKLNIFLRVRKTHRPLPNFQKTHLKPQTSSWETLRVKINAVVKV